jgi:hypothetical protein
MRLCALRGPDHYPERAGVGYACRRSRQANPRALPDGVFIHVQHRALQRPRLVVDLASQDVPVRYRIQAIPLGKPVVERPGNGVVDGLTWPANASPHGRSTHGCVAYRAPSVRIFIRA